MIETEDRSVYAPSDAFRATAHVKDMEDYRRRHAESLRDPEAFWAKEARRLEWMKPWDKVLDWNFSEPRIEWFRGGRLNVSANCLDRHLAAGLGSRTALIWEGNEPGESRHVSYAELHAEVCRFANALKSLGVQKGDRVAVYMPMVPELPVVLLACARIGAVHSVIFGGFSAESIRNRILDSSCSIVVTADEGLRGAKTIALKAVVDEALVGVDCVRHVVVFARTGKAVPMVPGRDIAWAEAVRGKDSACPPEPMESEDPLFILYTSGSTGKPKGVLHTTAGYLLHAAITHELIFDYHAGEVYWCTADIGWVTGHSYVVYGPLANGATTLLFEGIPTYPGIDRFWQVIEKHEVNIFYTAPTAIRALMREGPEPADVHPMESLRLLGTVGEPINPEAWRWYHRHVGKGRCPIVDTWWQTETGGILISPLPGAFPLKPGSATLPFFGVHPVVVDERGQPFPDGVPARGNLCISHPWPGIMRTVYGDHARFRDTYFSLYPGLYFTGDGCIRDEDGYYWITGRVDDVLNVSGHRIGTAEVESALVSHPSVAEAAVVGMPHDLKGQGIFAFVTVKTGIAATEELRKALGLHVRKVIGAHAAPDTLQFASGLPKTRSGKIMRRILRKIAGGESHDFGDTSTLADSSVLESLVPKRKAEED